MPFDTLGPDLFRWADTCNVYVLRSGDTALLIDLGDGSVLDALPQIGVKRVEWVLFTHHHREQCQGAGKLAGTRAKVAVPAAERALFENPTSYRKWAPTLTDPFTVYGASYVRPPVQPISVDRNISKMDEFTWRGYEFVCVQTPGNSPGHTTYLLKRDGRWLAFSGDLLLDGARFHTWFDTEWDYGFAKGIYELGNSAAQIAGYNPDVMYPSHGPVIRDCRRQLDGYLGKLKTLAGLYVRGYDLFRFAGADQDPVSTPTAVPHLWQITPHLYKFRGPDYWVNFAMLLADDGRALIIDCGLLDRDFLDRTLDKCKQRLGLKGIDAVFVTHIHGDHAQDAAHVRRKHGAELWALDQVADIFEHPETQDLAALLPYYTDRGKTDMADPLRFDRRFRDGESFDWHRFRLNVDWMPGQTKYHSCLHGVIDGRRVAFTGDNVFGRPTNPGQGGTEAVVARNGGALEEGYLAAADYLHTIAPDLLVGGHSWVMDRPAALIARLKQRAVDLREAFRALSPESEYRYSYDPYWVRAVPYRVQVRPGGGAAVVVRVRNYQPREQAHRLAVHCPPGLSASPATLDGRVPAETVGGHRLTIRVAADARPGVHLVAFDVTRDGVRHGELFDLLVLVG